MPSPCPGMDPYYERAAYDLSIDYTENPPPPALTEEEDRWLRSQSRSANGSPA